MVTDPFRKVPLTLTGNIEAVVHAVRHVNVNGPWWHVHRQIAGCNSVLITVRRLVDHA